MWLEKVITELDGCLHPADNFYLELHPDNIHTFRILYIPGRVDSVYGISVQLAYLLLYIVPEQNFSDNVLMNKVYTNDMWSYEQKKDACKFAAYFLIPEEIFSAYCKKYADENNMVNVLQLARIFSAPQSVIILVGKEIWLWTKPVQQHTSLIYTLNAGFLNRLEETADFRKKKPSEIK